MNNTTEQTSKPIRQAPDAGSIKPAIFSALRAVAPSLAFSASREPDPHFSWDGDGPDPRDEGFSPYGVTVSATAIHNGEAVSGEAYLGGSYYRHCEPIGEIHGYLNQMLEEALGDLATIIGHTPEVDAARQLILANR